MYFTFTAILVFFLEMAAWRSSTEKKNHRFALISVSPKPPTAHPGRYIGRYSAWPPAKDTLAKLQYLMKRIPV